MPWLLGILLTTESLPTGALAQDSGITVRADQVLGPVSRWLTGACIEDVNHEIYGGLYSQMIFGESFQEPPPSLPPQGFRAFGGLWKVTDGELDASGGDGPKLVSDLPGFGPGAAGVEVWFDDRKPGNAGLIVRVTHPGDGADTFRGYEIALDPSAQVLRLGRHRHNWELIRDTPCAVPTGRWIPLDVTLAGSVLEVRVDNRVVIRHDDAASPLLSGTVGLRQWQRPARYRNLWVKTDVDRHALDFRAPVSAAGDLSRMWHSIRRGNAAGTASLDPHHPFVGSQSQRITFAGGEGEFGIGNRSLNGWGMHFVGGRLYEGLLWARTAHAADVWVALENADGTRVLAGRRLDLRAGDWQRLEFALTPKSTESNGRFTVTLRRPGAVTLGYAFLQPGPWGRFKNLPVRRDVAEALIAQGITVLRYGGSMINHPEYRWKKMIGPRDRRPPHRGTWYPYSSNGWGILDFMEFCEAAGFEYIPAFNMGETPQDMADFIEYATGAPGSPWGGKRVADGHPGPYRLRYLQLGNEERVDEAYAATFAALAEVLWAKTPNLTLVVGDFVYGQPIRDPDDFRGAASGITNLSGQRRILELAKRHDREVWFDVHVGTDGPRPDATFDGMFSFRDALAKAAEGARHKVVVFEFNAGNPTQRRALANALAIQAIERDGRILIAASANCLQPDGQNDNGWDQGLLFLNPSKVWLQPPGYVTQMLSQNYQPFLVSCETTGTASSLDANAKKSADDRTLVLQVLNPTGQAVSAQIDLPGFTPKSPRAQVTELTGPLAGLNTADRPGTVVPRQSTWLHAIGKPTPNRVFPPYSITVIRFE